MDRGYQFLRWEQVLYNLIKNPTSFFLNPLSGRTPLLSPPCWASLGTAVVPEAVTTEPLEPLTPAHTAGITASAASQETAGPGAQSGEGADASLRVTDVELSQVCAWAVGQPRQGLILIFTSNTALFH